MKPLVSVIMVAGGNPEISYEAVKTLKEHARTEFQLLFVDNGSDKEEKLSDTVGQLLGTKDVLIRNEVGRSFARANNQALALADAPTVLGLNNDTVTEGDWQTPLLTEGRGFDLCGPNVRRLLICEDLKTMVCHRPNGKMADAEPEEVGSYVEGWCFFLRTEYWKALGGFDECFWPMYCEDSDLSFRVKAMGGKIGRVEVPIHHIGGADSKKYLDSKYKDTVGAANCHKMYARWVKGGLI